MASEWESKEDPGPWVRPNCNTMRGRRELREAHQFLPCLCDLVPLLHFGGKKNREREKIKNER